MKIITIDNVTYELHQIKPNEKNISHKDVNVIAYKELITGNESMKLSVGLKDDGEPFVFYDKIEYSITKGDDYLDNEQWNDGVYEYFKTGTWDYKFQNKDFADSFTEDEKAEFIALIDKAKELKWI